MNALELKLPPGPSYIASQLFSWRAASYLLFVASVRSGADAVGVHAPVWAIVASSAIVLPAVLYIQSGLRYWRDERTAAALGARLAPKVSGKKPLGLDLVAAMLEGNKSGYIGESQVFYHPPFKVYLIPTQAMELLTGSPNSVKPSIYGTWGPLMWVSHTSSVSPSAADGDC